MAAVQLGVMTVSFVFLAIALSAVGVGLYRIVSTHLATRREEKMRRITTARSRALARAAKR